MLIAKTQTKPKRFRNMLSTTTYDQGQQVQEVTAGSIMTPTCHTTQSKQDLIRALTTWKNESNSTRKHQQDLTFGLDENVKMT
eukprot:389849-Amphidinium_carterae.1